MKILHLSFTCRYVILSIMETYISFDYDAQHKNDNWMFQCSLKNCVSLAKCTIVPPKAAFSGSATETFN